MVRPSPQCLPAARAGDTGAKGSGSKGLKPLYNKRRVPFGKIRSKNPSLSPRNEKQKLIYPPGPSASRPPGERLGTVPVPAPVPTAASRSARPQEATGSSQRGKRWMSQQLSNEELTFGEASAAPVIMPGLTLPSTARPASFSPGSGPQGGRSSQTCFMNAAQ